LLHVAACSVASLAATAKSFRVAAIHQLLCCKNCSAVLLRIELCSDFGTITGSRTNTQARFFHAMVCPLFQSFPLKRIENLFSFFNKLIASERSLYHSIRFPITLWS
jgi:hypothetical protein